MFENLAKERGLEGKPTQIVLLHDPTREPGAITIATLLELRDTEIVMGTSFPDDIFRTLFDRFTGLALDGGRLSKLFIPGSELARIERHANEGTYVERKAAPVVPPAVPFFRPAPTAPPRQPPSSLLLFDPDEAMNWSAHS